MEQDSELETAIVPVPDSDMAVSLARGEHDVQIETAKKYPRSLKRAVGNILSMATLDEETAEECMYSVPRGGKTVEGPSARFAEIVFQQWGNCRVAARVIREDKDYVVAQGVYHDLETNTAISTEVQRRITGKSNKRYNADMIVNTGNAACSIARRNIILAGVPRPVWRKAYEGARQVVMGDIQTLGNRRAEAIKAFQRFGVTADQIYTVLGVAGELEITLDHLVPLRGMIAALKNSESTVEEMFGRGEKPAGDPNYNPLVEADTTEKTADTVAAKPSGDLKRNLTDYANGLKGMTQASSMAKWTSKFWADAGGFPPDNAGGATANKILATIRSALVDKAMSKEDMEKELAALLA